MRGPLFKVFLTFLAVCWVGQVACVEEFDPASLLGDDFQVLAIQADPPQVRSNQEVFLRSLVYLPSGETGSVDRMWFTCIPNLSEGALTCLQGLFMEVFSKAGLCAELCAGDADEEACIELCVAETFVDMSCDASTVQKGCFMGNGEEARYLVPEGLLEDPETSLTFYVYMLATALPAGLRECFDLWSRQGEAGQTISPTADCTLSLKRVDVVPDDEEVRGNPTLGGLGIDGADTAPPPTSTPITLPRGDLKKVSMKLELRVDAPLEADEFLSWFSDCGRLSKTKTFFDDLENTLKPTKTGTCSVFVVRRDGEGGVGWIERRLDLISP